MSGSSFPPYAVQKYLGQVATRCFLPQSFSSSNIWVVGKTRHRLWDDVTQIKVVYPSFYVSVGNAETGVTGGTLQAACLINGSYVQSVEGQVSFANGFAVQTFNVSGKRGQFFNLIGQVQNANGIVYSFYGNNTVALDPSEGADFGTGAPGAGYLTGATPVDASQVYYGPIAILAMTARSSFLIFGTSKAVGIYDVVTDQSADVGNVARLIGSRFGYSNLAIQGSQLGQFNAASKTYRNQLINGTIAGVATGVPYHSHVVTYDVINDLGGGGLTPAQCATVRQTFAALFPNARVVGLSQTPNSSSSDNFATLANQTPNASVATFNALARAGIVGEALFWDIADLIDPYRSGRWPVSRDADDVSVTTASFTGVISNYTLTASSVTGTINLRRALKGTSVAGGTFLVSQVSGTLNGAGTYALSQSQTISSETMTTGNIITWDGLHEGPAMNELIRDRGQYLLDQAIWP